MKRLPRLAITGASGFLARYVMRALKTQYRFVALDRHPRMESQVPPDGEVEWHQVDLGDRDQTLATFRRIAARGGAEAIVHLAAHYDFTGEDDPEYWRTNVDGLRNVLDGCRALRLRQFVFASSLAACELPPPGAVLTEDSPADGEHVYARTKRIGEAMVASYRHTFPATIVRFAALYSDWCEYPPLYAFLGNWLSGGWRSRVLAGRGESAVPYLHVRDAAVFVRAALGHRLDLAPGQVVIASSDEVVSHLKLFRAATRAYFGTPLDPRFMPRLLCRPGLWVLDEVGRRFGDRPFERPWMARYVDRQLSVDASRTRTLLGWEPRIRLQILRRMPFLVENFRTDPVEWHRRNQQFMMLRRQLPNLRLYQILLDRREEIVWRLEELMSQGGAERRMSRYQELSREERQWNHRMILRNLLHAVRSQRKGLFMAYCRDLAERRAAQGFPVAEVVHALSALHRACREVLSRTSEAKGLGPEVHETVSQTIRFGIDQVQMVYEAIQGETDRRARVGHHEPAPPPRSHLAGR
jgi:nucleoside-diphosphate-sugar epimerase